ncbi:MAG TPA: Fur family transcriptional regulator [bacterium]|nr:Fur family transcriptional regulator [bacterium]
MRLSDPTIIGLLRSRGLRPTRASRLILARLRHSNDHLSAEELRGALRRRGHVVSIATLYQNLARLSEAGLLASFADSEGLVRYDANTAPHAHLVCSRCGRILDLPMTNPLVNRLNISSGRRTRQYRGWAVQNARLELCGLCPKCRR